MKFRRYDRAPNFLLHRCVHVPVTFHEQWQMPDCPERYWEENVVNDIEAWVKGRWGWDQRHGKLFFEDENDALVARLKYE